MTGINMFNNIFNSVNPGSQAATSAQGASSPMPAATGSALSGNLMDQLIEDTENLNSRTPAATVLQALRDAGLAETAQNIDLVNALINNNLSIGRDNLKNYSAQMRAYPDAGADVLIALNKSGIPVTESSVYAAKELLSDSPVMISNINELADMTEAILSDPSTPAQLSDDIRQAVFDAVFDNLYDYMGSLSTSGESSSPASSGAGIANGIYDSLFQTLAVTPEALGASGAGLAGLASGIRAEAVPVSPERIVVQTESQTPLRDATSDMGSEAGRNALGGSLSGSNEGLADLRQSVNTPLQNAGEVSAENPSALADGAVPGAVESAYEDIMSVKIREDISGHNDYSFRDFEELADALADQPDNQSIVPDRENLREAIRPQMSEAFKNLPPSDIKKLLKASLSLTPEKLSRETIKAVYKRSTEFFAKIRDAAEQTPGHEALHAKASQAAEDNSLLNTLNRMYPHIELPLKLQNSETEGGLYVYTNRGARSHNDGRVTALLHLKMPNLGLIDIHLDLNAEKLGMNYYCEDDAGKLLAGDITSLKGDLEKMGYSVFTKFSSRDFAEKGIRAAFHEEPGDAPRERSDRLSFDTRA